MNKVKVGALAVSRYHQIERFFPVDDSPNVPDHDFPVPGYLLIPSGYMRLLKNASDSECIEESRDLESYAEPAANDICEGDVNNNQTAQETDLQCTCCGQCGDTYSTTNVVGSISTMVGNVSATVHGFCFGCSRFC